MGILRRKSSPRAFRPLWGGLLGLAFLFGMPATYATACSPHYLAAPTVSLSFDSSYIEQTADFGSTKPNKYCWVVELLPDNSNDWQVVEENCNETPSFYTNNQQYIYWANTSVTPGGRGYMKAKARALHTSCPYWSPWGYSGSQSYRRPSGG